MSRFQGARPPHILLLALAYFAIAIPVAGWIIAQSSDDRIAEAWQFTAAMVHGFAASTFAVIFATSTIINAIIVTFRFRDAPLSYRFGGYPLWQAIVIVLGTAWATTVALTVESSYVEMAFGLGVAAASIGACVQAARQDAESSDWREARLALRREARTTSRKRVVRGLQVAIPVALGVGFVTAIISAQLVVTVHRGCEIVGTGNVNGEVSIYTEPCGNFAVDLSRVPQTEVDRYFYGSEPVDVTTQGYAFGIPPVPVLIEIGDAD